MAGNAWLTGRYVRRSWLGLVPLAVIVAAGGTASLVAFGAAQRTATAYSRYVDRGAVGDLSLNPSLNTVEIDAVIRSLPGVRSVHTDELLFATPFDDGHPRPFSAIDEDNSGGNIVGSVDGRHVLVDRPALAAGRLPTGPDEVLVNTEAADQRGIKVGDVVPMAFWSAHDDIAAQEGDPSMVVAPVGVEQLTVVGIATLPDEVLPDNLYARQRMVVSPDVAARYACSPGPLPNADNWEDIAATLFPPGCSTSYRFYSLAVDGGTKGIAAAEDAFVRRGSELNDALPQALQDRGVRYELLPTTAAQGRDRIERSTQPTVAALTVLGAAAAAVTVVIAALTAARGLRRRDQEQLQWWRLGLTAADRAWVLAVPMVVAVVVGSAVAVAAAWWLSPVGPVGSVRSVEPFPAREVTTSVLIAAVALTVVLVAVIAGLAVRRSRSVGESPARRRDLPLVRRLVRSSARPEISEGIRAAFGGNRGAAVVVASGTIATAVFLAAVVFGTSLSALVSTPRSYGWPWDLGVMVNFGYGGLDDGAVQASVDRRTDVDRWTSLAFTNSVAVDGDPVLSMMVAGGTSSAGFAVVEGRLPAADDEVALGERTAADHHVGVGDTVDLAGVGIESKRATVTGLAVLPALGPFEADRATPGDGMVLPATMFADGAVAGSFVGINFVAGTDRDAAVADLRTDVNGWGPPGFTTAYDEPVRPAEIVNARSMRAVPLLVGGLLAVAVVVGLSFAVVVSVRSRRRELAILRALGFTARQLRASVRVQSAATTLAALVIGVPLGIVLGRTAWRAFASGLAVAQEPSTPAGWILATVVGALGISLLASAVPARMAARATPAAALRSE